MSRRRALIGAGSGLTENFVRIGSPTIVNGIMTPSADSWILVPNTFSPASGDTWELVFKIKQTGNRGFQNIITSAGIMLQIPSTTSTANIYLKSEGSSSWNISNGNYYVTLTLNQWSWIKILFNGTKYAVLLSSDGVNYTTVRNYSNSATLFASAFHFGAKASNTSAVQAEYDLNECYIKLNNQFWWRAYT